MKFTMSRVNEVRTISSSTNGFLYSVRSDHDARSQPKRRPVATRADSAEYLPSSSSASGSDVST